MNQQTSKYLMLIRPRSFSSNEETLASNDFQNQFEESSNLSSIRAAVDLEFTNMISVLSDHEIDHVVFEDIEGLGSPDAIFPNNWVTFHDDGTVVLYPMMSRKRRKERRHDIIERLDKIIYNEIDKDSKDKSFLVSDEMISLLGCSRENMKLIIKDLGFIKNNKKICKSDGNEIISEDPEIWYKKKYNHGASIKKKSKKFKKKSEKETASNFFAENNDLKK